MNFYSRDRFQKMCARLAQTYGVASTETMFDVQIPQAVGLINAIQQSVGFLSRVSVIPVTDMKGRIVTLNAPGMIASRTDTSSGSKERIPAVIGDKSERTYEVVQTNYDCALKYSDIDAWRRFSDYEQRILNMIYRRMGLDQLMIGWYGESAAKDTNAATNPLGQDVNTGWFHDLKTNKPENFIKAASGSKLKLGKGGDWNNLDQLVFELLSLIPEEHRTGNEVALVGRKIVAWESGKIYEMYGQRPSEKTLFSVLTKTYGGLPATTPACFPDTGVMVVDPSNLQHYIQDSSLRRQMLDNPRKDQIEHFQSQNECFRIGDLDACAAVNHADVEFVSESTSADEPAENPTENPDQGQQNG